MRSRSLLIPLTLALLVPAAAARADGDDENPHVWRPRTKSVAVFKNGLGFFMREGEVELRDGWAAADAVPPAAFGTLAIYSHDEGQEVDVVGSGPGEIVEFDGVDAADDDATRRRRLEGYQNLEVELVYERHDRELRASGELVSVGPEFAILERSDGTHAVPISGITRLQLLGLPLRVHVAADGKKDSARKKATLGMAYLRKGITWIPEYSLKVIDDEHAELVLRGTVVNEAEDIIHGRVSLVVGVPHFAHSSYLSPIAVGQTIRAIGSAVAPAALRGQIMNRAAIASNAFQADQFAHGGGGDGGVVEQPAGGASGDPSAAAGNVPVESNAAGTDYTVYTIEDLTIRRGEKAIVTLFKATIRYDHIYRWTPPGALEHFLVLKNDTDTAWTTGPCVAISGSHPLGEDLIRYTPKGGRCEYQVTTAVNVAHEATEREVDRKLKAHSIHRDLHLDLVTLEGEVRLKNFEKRPVRVVITKQVAGRPTSATDEGKTSIDPTQLQLTKRHGAVRWSIDVGPGESKVLRYRYERYVPSS